MANLLPALIRAYADRAYASLVFSNTCVDAYLYERLRCHQLSAPETVLGCVAPGALVNTPAGF